jgi:hypothetical protein
MSVIHILIVIALYGNQPNTAMQEFDNAAACSHAARQVLNQRGGVVAFCVPKK